MKITTLQAEVLENLHRIRVTRGGKQTRYSLDGRDCRYQIISLAVQGAIRWDGQGMPSRLVSEKIPIPQHGRPKVDGPG